MSAPLPQGDEEGSFDYDTDEIRSIDSEDLYEARPNRWKGPKSTWRTLTEDDRLTHVALEQSRNQDLAVHLYNAFALKHRHQRRDGSRSGSAVAGDPSRGQDVDKITGQAIDWNSNWEPSALWTAWPLRRGVLPPDVFFKTAGDDDEPDAQDVYRHPRPPAHPSAALEEAISAAMLKLATAKFRKRGLADLKKYQKGEDETMEESELPRVQSSPSPAPKSDPDTKRSTPEANSTFSPVISADDQRSYELLRPSARHILASLDRALTVLHNARVAGMNYLSESSATNTSDSEAGSERQRPRRGRGRPRSKTPGRRTASAALMSSPERNDAPPYKTGRPRTRYAAQEGESEKEALERVARQRHDKMPAYSSGSEQEREEEEHESFETAAEEEEDQKQQQHHRRKRNRGKPRKAYPRLQGETERAYLVRIARLQHKKIPEFSDSDNDEKQQTEADPAATTSGGEGTTPQPQAPTPTITDEQRQAHRQALLGSWAPRDWSDVLAAAALAGFSPEVLSRTARRCAALFGEGVDMRTLPPHRGAVVTTRYGGDAGIKPTVEAEDDDSDDDAEAADTVRQLRAVSRHSSAALSDDDRRGTKRARTRSSSAGRGVVYCRHADCARAVQGFSRRANLARHLRLVHGEEDEGGAGASSGARGTPTLPGAGGAGDEGPAPPPAGGRGLVDTDMYGYDYDGYSEEGEEMSGGVHVDGFLQPIKTQKGWRGEGLKKPKKARGMASGDDDGEDDDKTVMMSREYGVESDS